MVIESGMRVAVTGATGFLGGYIVKGLLDAGVGVVAVVRDAARSAYLDREGVEIRVADLQDRGRMARAFSGCSVVVAAAAKVAVLTNNPDAMMKINASGTENLVLACADAGVGRLIYISSAAVYRDLREAGGPSETSIMYEHGDLPKSSTAYGISKAAAERGAWGLCREHGISMTSLRPYTVFGAFDKKTFSKMCDREMNRKIAIVPTGVHVPFVYAGDVADAVLLCISRDESIGHAFNLGGDMCSFTEFAQHWEAAYQKSPWLKIPLPLRIRRYMNDQKAREVLGWKTTPIKDSLVEIAATTKKGGHFY